MCAEVEFTSDPSLEQTAMEEKNPARAVSISRHIHPAADPETKPKLVYVITDHRGMGTVELGPDVQKWTQHTLVTGGLAFRNKNDVQTARVYITQHLGWLALAQAIVPRGPCKAAPKGPEC